MVAAAAGEVDVAWAAEETAEWTAAADNAMQSR